MYFFKFLKEVSTLTKTAFINKKKQYKLYFSYMLMVYVIYSRYVKPDFQLY